MRKLFLIVLCAAALVGLFALLTPTVVDAAVPLCPMGKVACYNCDGSFAYCARSHAFCPECAAPA